jgi:uncharacterized protein (TIGR00661 family)
MRILYGVVGEGMGHATRSRVVLEHLTRNHDVHIVVSGRARDYLARRFENVHHIWGLTISYGENSVKKWQTVVQNLRGAVTGWPQNIRTYFELVENFSPDVVISDFESFSYLFARRHALPVISVDNIQIVNRCTHDPQLLLGHEGNFELIRSVVKGKLPGAFHYLISSFFYPPVRKARTTLTPSILRPEILAARPEPGDHLLVYQTATGNTALIEQLKALGIPCRVYGYRRDLTADVADGQLLLRPFSEPGFIEDLRTARAVVGGGGYTLMSEAVYLGKPMLSVPVGGQFEQVLNALYLQHLGYGASARALDSEVLGGFLERVPDCARALRGYTQDGNTVLLSALDRLLVEARARKGMAWGDGPADEP